jgi:hypothetical protein
MKQERTKRGRGQRTDAARDARDRRVHEIERLKKETERPRVRAPSKRSGLRISNASSRGTGRIPRPPPNRRLPMASQVANGCVVVASGVGARPAGQPGHPVRHPAPVPPERVDAVVELVPNNARERLATSPSALLTCRSASAKSRFSIGSTLAMSSARVRVRRARRTDRRRSDATTDRGDNLLLSSASRCSSGPLTATEVAYPLNCYVR